MAVMIFSTKNAFRKKNLFVVVIILLCSCEKNITVDIPHAESKIVVEGFISSGSKPFVYLSKSASFFDPLDSASLLKYVVRGALVVVSDGSTSDTLREALPGFGYYYTADNMIGQDGKTYSLFVVAEGETLTAVTQIPIPIPLDSVWFKLQGNLDSLGFAWAHLTDPDTLGNAYRWFAKRINKDDDFLAPIGSVFEDKFFNGKSFDFAYNRGQPPNSDNPEDLGDERGYFKIGDTIAIKFCAIDREHFEFWRSVETQEANNGNPFASSAPIDGNINGGLGIWGGYGLSFDTIYAK